VSRRTAAPFALLKESFEISASFDFCERALFRFGVKPVIRSIFGANRYGDGGHHAFPIHRYSPMPSETAFDLRSKVDSRFSVARLPIFVG
jgi:hypothetical protein